MDRRDSARVAAWTAVLVLASVVVYGRVGTFEFIGYDDPGYVSANPHVLGGPTPENLGWAWTTFERANWHPVTWMSLQLDAALRGTGPGPFHVTNALLHACNALLLMLLLRAATGSTHRSSWVALVFAVHPLHVESVAWISERKDVLSTLFGLLATLAWIRWARRRSRTSYVAALGAYAVGLLAKPMLVSLPLVWLLLDIWPLRDRPVRWPARIREKAPFFILAAASCVVTLVAQSKGGAVGSLEVYPWWARLANAAVSYVAYLASAAWPSHLALPYPFHMEALTSWRVAGAGLVLLALSGAAWSLRSRAPYVLVGWGWYLVTLLPVIGIVQVGVQARADRYLYLPLVGVLVAITWGAAEFAQSRSMPARGRALRWLLLAGAAACGGLAVAAHRQVALWSDTRTLFEHTLRVTGPNAVAHHVLGVHFLERGDRQGALAQLQEAVRLSPGNAEMRQNLGVAWMRSGALDAAIAELGEADRLHPGDGTTLANLGAALLGAGRIAEAERTLLEASERLPTNAPVLANLSLAQLRMGRTEAAANSVSRALRLDPENATAHAIAARLRIRN